MPIRKLFGILSLITWLTFFVLLVIANKTTIPTGEQLIHPAITAAGGFGVLFVAISFSNTILMVFDKTAVSIAWQALFFFGVMIVVFLAMVALSIDPGPSSMLYQSRIMDYLVICFITGAIFDVADLFLTKK